MRTIRAALLAGVAGCLALGLTMPAAHAQVVGGNGSNAVGSTPGTGGTTGDGSTITATGTTSAGSGGAGTSDNPIGNPGTGANPGAGDNAFSATNAGGGGAESGGGGGGSGSGGTGGGGGGGGARAATLFGGNPNVIQTYTGGSGGNGADGVGNAGGGGGGGGGGYGVVAGGLGFVLVFADVTGGAGGNGGASGLANANSGNGGAGGDAVLVVTNGMGVIVAATVQGGNGGQAGTGPGGTGTAGAGGAGLVGSGLSVTNIGTISGGLSGDGTTRADAITFTGGTNSLTLSSGPIGQTPGAIGTLNGGIGISGSLSINPGNNGSTGNNVTLGNVIHDGPNGAGSVIMTSGGTTLTLTGTNTYSGSTTISSGTLALSGSGSIANSSAVNLEMNATFDVSQSTNGFPFATVSITTLGNTASGATGTVALGGTTLRVTNASTTFAGVIADGGIANNSGGSFYVLGGTQTLSGMNTYTGLTVIQNATLALTGRGSIATSSAVSIGSGTSTFDISNTMSGASIRSLEGDPSGGGIVNLGSKTLTITNGGGSLARFFGAINGSGGLTISGGSQNLGGVNGYTGVTTIDSGATLSLLGSGSIAGSSKVIDNGILVGGLATSIKSLAGTNSSASVVLNSQTLTLTAANDTFAGQIVGPGGNIILSAGHQTLTGSNSYTGTTTVNGGTLQVDGSIATSSLSSVNSGGTLSGVGTVGATQVNAGGAFAPGNGAPGMMAVNGSLAFASGAFYMVSLNPTTASFANVTGSATLGGATVNATFANGSYVAKQYTILTTTGGLNATTFGSLVNSNLPFGFKTTLSYDANDVFLNLSLAFVPPPGSGLSGNQQSVGNAISNFFNANGSIPLVFGSLTPAGLSQLSGESATGSQQTTFNAMSQFMDVLTDPFAGRGGTANPSNGAPAFAEDESLGYAARDRRTASEREAYAMFTKAPLAKVYEPRWSVWASGFGGSQQTDGSSAAGSNNTSSSIYGTAVGADYLFSPRTIAGFALAGGGTNFSVNGLGSGRSDLFQAGAYVRHTSGAAYVTGALAYGWQDITTNRTVTIAGLDQLRAEFNANAYSGRVEGGYRFVAPGIGGVGITPYAAGQFTTFDLPAYAESVVSGGGAFAQAYGAKSVTDSRSELGLRTDKAFAMADGIVTLRGRLAWAHDFNPDRSVAATFQALPGASFVVNGAAQAADSALVTAAAEKKWLNGWSAAAAFEGEFSDVTRSYAGKGVVRYAW